jgi:hypothetical protein
MKLEKYSKETSSWNYRSGSGADLDEAGNFKLDMILALASVEAGNGVDSKLELEICCVQLAETESVGSVWPSMQNIVCSL